MGSWWVDTPVPPGWDTFETCSPQAPPVPSGFKPRLPAAVNGLGKYTPERRGSLPISLPHAPSRDSWINDLDVHPGLSIQFCENRYQGRERHLGLVPGSSRARMGPPALGLPVFSVLCGCPRPCYGCQYICVCLSPLAADWPVFSVTSPDSTEYV